MLGNLKRLERQIRRRRAAGIDEKHRGPRLKALQQLAQLGFFRGRFERPLCGLKVANDKQLDDFIGGSFTEQVLDLSQRGGEVARVIKLRQAIDLPQDILAIMSGAADDDGRDRVPDAA